MPRLLPYLAQLAPIIAVWSAITTPLAAQDISGQAEVVDGNTLIINGSEIRLYGIDAPHLEQTCRTRPGRVYPCGEFARDRLQDLIGDDQVRCNVIHEDSYDRLIANCRTDRWHLGKAMVVFGWAMAYREISNAFDELENHARTEERGIWSGSFEPPWVWRARNLPDEDDTAEEAGQDQQANANGQD